VLVEEESARLARWAPEVGAEYVRVRAGAILQGVGAREKEGVERVVEVLQ
jgi:hypothetical protein